MYQEDDKVKSKVWLPILVVLGMAAFCQVAFEALGIPKFILPKPSLILEALWQDLPRILPHLEVTMMEAIIGFAIAVTVGILLSLVCLFLPTLRPIVVSGAYAVRNVPFVAIAPVLFIILGYGPTAKIVIVLIVSFFPVMSNLTAGFDSVNQNLLERLYLYRASRWQLFIKLQLPAAVPSFVTGLENAISNIIIAAIVGELLGTTQGLGFVIMMTVSQYKISSLMAVVVLVTVVSILTTWLFLKSVKWLFRRWLEC